MMKWGWDFNRNLRGEQEVPIAISESRANNLSPTLRIGTVNTMNGTVLEIGTYTHSRHGGGDWTYEHFIVPEGKLLSEAITMFLKLKGIDK